MDICEFGASMVYKVSFWTAGAATLRDPVLKHPLLQKEKYYSYSAIFYMAPTYGADLMSFTSGWNPKYTREEQ